jgi:hypothetical protein
MKIIIKRIWDWISRTYYGIIAWIILHDGHTISHYICNNKQIVTNNKGNIILWKDLSGNGNHAKSCPPDDVYVNEIIIRNVIDSAGKQTAIFISMKHKKYQ